MSRLILKLTQSSNDPLSNSCLHSRTGVAPARLNPETSRQLNRLIYTSNARYVRAGKLALPGVSVIRAGTAGGLPFDSLTTDVVTGCLPERQACYGMCFAARSAWENGIDFGTRVRNTLDPDRLAQDMEALPPAQGYVRNGWNSDPSWAWDLALDLARIVRISGKLIVFITKSFIKADRATMTALVATGAEMRVSISALDNGIQLANRMQFILDYRAAGGIAVPILMSAAYAGHELASRQKNIVEWLCAHDLPAAENSLRVPVDAPLAGLIDVKRTRPIATSDEIWSGRLYPERLIVPTTTSVPDSYRGMRSGFLSRIDRDFIRKLYCDPVMTHEEVMSSPGALRHPRQCGVAATSSMPETGG